jgi:hypothetical protein
MPKDFLLFGLIILLLYLIASAKTEMFTRWPKRRK